MSPLCALRESSGASAPCVASVLRTRFCARHRLGAAAGGSCSQSAAPSARDLNQAAPNTRATADPTLSMAAKVFFHISAKPLLVQVQVRAVVSCPALVQDDDALPAEEEQCESNVQVVRREFLSFCHSLARHASCDDARAHCVAGKTEGCPA